ncbi:ankyrin repeat domain containing protein [Pandoravirus celtis]|uniref:Ankyrin repeat domain containing protein n=1 Tax=Pandoravirus celtis TaxID=2568002 RepID=A0A4D6EGD5_9VIRU|nr:ankyrin repeat domain containing protein [Pandoravirus celtis]
MADSFFFIDWPLSSISSRSLCRPSFLSLRPFLLACSPRRHLFEHSHWSMPSFVAFLMIIFSVFFFPLLMATVSSLVFSVSLAALPLPNELLSAVLSFLDPVDSVAASRVQRLWRAFAPPLCAFGPAYAAQLAARGHLDVLQWARTHGCPCDTVAASAAARAGHLHVLQWLYDNKCPWNGDACDEAAKGGHLEVLQWLRANGCPWDPWLCCVRAAEHGHLDVLQWLHANGCPLSESVCIGAAEHGHLDVLQWLCANGCPWDKRVAVRAAAGGHLDVLQWLHANGCAPNADACFAAAMRGHLQVIQWLRANNWPWDHNVCFRAVVNGHLEVLQWLHANGCPWYDGASACAARCGQWAVLKWLHANGFLGTLMTSTMTRRVRQGRPRRPPGYVAVAACQRPLFVGHGRLCRGRRWWASRRPPVAPRQRLPLGCPRLCRGRRGRPSRGPPVASRQRLPLGRACLQARCQRGPPGDHAMALGQRLSAKHRRLHTRRPQERRRYRPLDQAGGRRGR